MICVVVNRHLSPEEVDEIRDFRGKGDYKFLFLKDINVELHAMGFEKFELSNEKRSEVYYDVLKGLNDFGDKKVSDKSISEWMNQDKAGVWYYNRFRIYFYLRELAYEHVVMQGLSSEYEKVIAFTGDNELLKNVDLLEIRKGKDIIKGKPDYLSYINYALLVVIRSLITIFRISKLRKIKHIVLAPSNRQSGLDFNTMKIVKDVFILSYFYNKLDPDFVILDYTQMPRLYTDDKIRIKRYHYSSIHKDKLRIYEEYFLLRAILSSKIRKKLKKASTNLLEIYDKIENSVSSDLEKVILMQYRKYHKSTLLYLLKYFTYDKLFSKHRFSTISGIDENSPGVKSIFEAAGKNHITTIGLQHGSIYDLSVAYMYSKIDKDRNVMADYTMLWGDKWKETLINKGNFREESLIITGQIRTDIIPKLHSVDRQSVIKNIDPDKSLVVFASQPQPDQQQRRQAALDVFGSVRDMKNVFLLVKLHPAEREDTGYYHKLAKESNCSNYSLMYDIDLFLLLSVCDIMITCYSTVGMETIYFGKPLIIHDPFKLDMASYFKEGVAFQATNENELEMYIEKILSSELKINQEAYKRFISGYAYKIDGKASERCLNFIKSLRS